MGFKGRDGINDELAEVAFDVVRGYCKQQGMPMKWLADTMNYIPTSFSNYLNGHRTLPASAVVRITRRCGYELISALCYQCGGVFLPTPDRTPAGDSRAAYRAALRFVETSGPAARDFFKSLEDGKQTKDEYDRNSKWLSKLSEVIVAMHKAFDEMPIAKESDDDQQ
jgi:hypothetical protein